MTATPVPTVLRLADLPQRRATAFDIRPDADARSDLIKALDLMDLRKLSLIGQLEPTGASDWRLTAQLGATVVQPCVATLAPVTTRIDHPITRLFSAHAPTPAEAEAEMPEDDSIDPLPEAVDLLALLEEELALALPAYPRASDGDLPPQTFTEPGKTPLSDEDARPFAGLAALRETLSKDGD